jgi:hypothetical protein
MRCYCCNNNLTDFESTRRSAETGDFLEMCNRCVKGMGIATVDRIDLAGTTPLPIEDEEPDSDLELLKGVHHEVPFFDDEL